MPGGIFYEIWPLEKGRNLISHHSGVPSKLGPLGLDYLLKARSVGSYVITGVQGKPVGRDPWLERPVERKKIPDGESGAAICNGQL